MMPHRKVQHWVECSSDGGHVVAFPAKRLTRFVAVQMVAPQQWRAAVFVGWHLDPSIRPSSLMGTYAEALSRAEKGARSMGLPLISDRCSVIRRGVWSAPA